MRLSEDKPARHVVGDRHVVDERHLIDAPHAPSAFSPLGVVFVVLWSSAWIAGKVGLPYAGPFTLLLIRFSAAGAVLLAVALASGAPWPERLGLSAGLIGVVLVVIDRVSLGGASWEGYAASIAALVALACGTLYQKKYCSGMDLRTGSFIQVAAVGAVVLLPALHFEGLQVEWNWTLVLASSWLSLANSIGAFSLLYVLLRKGEASRVSALFYLVPPITAVMGFAAFHETLSPAALAGFAITVGGVYLGTRPDAS